MADAPSTAPEAFNSILTQPAGLLRLASALPRIIYAVVVAPKPFFGAIGAANSPSILNAFGFFVVAMTAYVILFILVDEALVRIAGYDSLSLISFYADPFEHEGIPFSPALGFLAALGDTAAQSLFAVAQWTASIWFLATAFIHSGKIASARAMLVAGLYATGAITLVFSIVGLPAVYFDRTFNPQAFLASPGTLLYEFTRFATAAGLSTKYELVFIYLYLRSVSFTTDLRLHWGFVFTILLTATGVLLMQAI